MKVKDIINIADENNTIEVYTEDNTLIGVADGKDTIEEEVLEREIIHIEAATNRPGTIFVDVR